ncbi:Pum2 [Symbiodinium sp. CCMP2592]|nr:Pum2 [Symbiodinium sp. CCMP2592]
MPHMLASSCFGSSHPRRLRFEAMADDRAAVASPDRQPEMATSGLTMGPKGTMIITAPEPSHADMFYATTNGQYCGNWHNGLPGHQLGDVPAISDILGARPTIKKPVRPIQTTAKCVLANQIAEEKRSMEADKVLSADVVPKKFPVQAQNYCYPPSGKRGANNPLYATSAQAYGSEMPMDHQVPDRYFPSTNQFTKAFVDTKPRYTGLSTAPTPSKVHKELDMFY